MDVMSTVYRGIAFNEALHVVNKQRYEREERRYFLDGVVAKAVFGEGIYLVHDTEMAAQYAFCHAETENDFAAVISQQLTLDNPMILHRDYNEADLRKDALEWKYPDGNLPDDMWHTEPMLRVEKTGAIMREYLLQMKYDGIKYHVNNEFIYYISYFPCTQISDIRIDFIFDIHDLKNASVQVLRERYKQKNQYR